MKNTLLFWFAFLSTALGQAQSPATVPQSNRIEVTGTSLISVLPDQIYLRIRIADPRKRISQLQQKQEQMLGRFKEIGIDLSKEVTIRDLASNYTMKVFSADDIIVTREYIVLVHDAASANKVISILEDLQISNVVIDHVHHTQYDELKMKGLLEATSIARKKAQLMATAVNQELGKATSIEERNREVHTNAIVGMENQRLKYQSEASMSSDKFLSSLSFESIEIVNTVFIRFELK